MVIESKEMMARSYRVCLKVIPLQFGSLSGSGERLAEPWRRTWAGRPLGPSRGPHPCLRRNVEHLRPALKFRKHGRIGAGEEHLAAEARERVVQRGAAARVEMGRDLVEKRERRDPRHIGDQARMGERQPDDQRLLFAGRGGAAGACFGPCQTRRSERCGPMSVRPAAASRPRLSRRLAR